MNIFHNAILHGTLMLACISVSSSLHAAMTSKGPAGTQLQNQIANLPLVFETNQGQAGSSVKFLSNGPGFKLFLTSKEMVMVLEKGSPSLQTEAKDPALRNKKDVAVIRTRFVGSNTALKVEGIAPLDFKINYLIGADLSRHITGVTSHARVKYASIYPGVDLIYYGNPTQLEYDFVVAPRASPDLIKLDFTGAEKISISNNGDLVLATAAGDLVHHKPIAYQNIAGNRKSVEADYHLAANGHVTFKVGKYDRSKPLIIDPIVAYASFLWASARGAAIDGSGNIYIVGATNATNLPPSTGYQTKLTGKSDAYVVKLDPSGTQIIYATYLGARNAYTFGNRIALDAAGNAYIAGTTDSGSFPVTPGAYQTSARSGGAYITKLNSTGNALVYSTYLSDANEITSTAVDSSGSFYMTGAAAVLKTTAGAFQTGNPNISGGNSPFVAKLNATGTTMVYATYLGGNGIGGGDEAKSIAIDTSGNAYLAGKTRSVNFPTVNSYQSSLLGSSSAFVSKLNPTGAGLVYSTYLGGAAIDSGNAIAINAAGEAFVAGQTGSADFPVTAGVFQSSKGYPGLAMTNGFISRLNAEGSGLIYSSFLGGTWCSGCRYADSDNDTASAVAVDSAGYAYIGGLAKSPAFPVADAIQVTARQGDGDRQRWPFVAKITPLADRLVYSTLLGDGENNYYPIKQIVLDPNGGALALGGYPTTFGGTVHDLASHPITAGAWLTSGPTYMIKINTGKYPTTVQSSLNPAIGNQSITFTARVLSTKSGGTVTFMNGAATLASAPVTNGIAEYTASLPAGVHKITAVYSMDGNTSPPIFQIVNSQ